MAVDNQVRPRRCNELLASRLASAMIMEDKKRFVSDYAKSGKHQVQLSGFHKLCDSEFSFFMVENGF